MTEQQPEAEWNVAEWHRKMAVHRDDQRIGKPEDVYVAVENDERQFATVKEGFIARHLTFVAHRGLNIAPDELQVAVSKQQVQSARNIEQHGEDPSRADTAALDRRFELNYGPPDTESGRRLVRR